MNKNDYIIRLERKEEFREVENLVREAFWNVYRPGCLEHYVLNQLRDNEAFVPEYKRQGYGKILLDYSIAKATELGCGADDSFFLCKELIPGYLSGITGEYASPQGYFVDEEEAEAFDKSFPYKEKLILPGQLFKYTNKTSV